MNHRACVLTAGLLVSGLSLAIPGRDLNANSFDSGKLGFSVRFKNEVSHYRVMGVFVLPGEALDLQVRANAGEAFTVEATGGRLVRINPRRWRWSADSTGLYPVRISSSATNEIMTLNVFVRVPANQVQKGILNGYRIGSYPKIRLRGLAIYDAPRGFIEVTATNQETLVSPHFRLRQFLCKQSSGFPKYVALSERLLLKLELILAKANQAGMACETFHVMSGYRTPHYNQQIGNVKYSRHLWGDATDIFVDVEPQDGFMDDLNGDGKIDVNDAGVLYDLIDKMYGQAFYSPFRGGLGRYRKTSRHPPFVHVDTRGTRARWGD